MTNILDTVHDARSVESLITIGNSKVKYSYNIFTTSPEIIIDEDFINYCRTLLKNKEIYTSTDSIQLYCDHITKNNIVIRIFLDETVDINTIISKLSDDLTKANDLINRLIQQTNIPGYEDKVPESVREDNSAKV